VAADHFDVLRILKLDHFIYIQKMVDEMWDEWDPRRRVDQGDFEGKNIRANGRSEKRPRTRAFFCWCPLDDFALFYVKLTSAGSPDPVTSLILKHSSDWVSQSGLFCFVSKREVRKRKQRGGLHSKD